MDLQTEAKQFVTSVVMDMWPDWSPGGRVLEVWIESLMPYSWQVADSAVKALYADGGDRWREPKLSDFKKKLAIFGRQSAVEGEKAGKTFRNYHCQCVEHHSPKRLFNYFEYTTTTENADLLMKEATRTCERLAETNGGRWVSHFEGWHCESCEWGGNDEQLAVEGQQVKCPNCGEPPTTVRHRLFEAKRGKQMQLR